MNIYHVLFIVLLQKDVKSCRIRHTYGDDYVEDPFNEKEAVMLTKTATADGTARPPPMLQPVYPHAEASLEVGGKALS
ncbi:hypothetical protein ACROYT_G014749 [Oculina patagonica]